MKSPEVTVTSFAGIRNTLPAERLNPHDLVEAVNVDLDTSGHPSRRAGQTMKVIGASHSLWAEGGLCLFIKDGVMKQLNPDYSTHTLATGLNDDPMAYLHVAGRTYHSNGAQTGVLDSGHVRAWGIGIDGIVAHGTITAGTLLAGSYQYAMTYIRNDGQESGTGIATRIDLPDGAGINFTWDIPDDLTIVDVALYLTQPNGETLLQAAVVDVEAGQFTYAGGHRSLPLATQWYDAPPAGQCLALYRGRIYIAAGAFLFATAAHGYEYCDLRDYLAIDGSRITMIAPLEFGMLVGTEKGVYFLSGNALTEFAIVLREGSGALPGSLLMLDGQAVTGNPQITGKVALFTLTDGIYLGMPDGSTSSLTQERFALDVSGTAAAGFRNDGTLAQYLLSIAAAEPAPVVVPVAPIPPAPSINAYAGVGTSQGSVQVDGVGAAIVEAVGSADGVAD